MKRMTQKEYRETAGIQCPACRSDSTEPMGQQFDDGPGTMTWKYACFECPATWAKTWKLTGYKEWRLTGYRDLKRSTS